MVKRTSLVVAMLLLFLCPVFSFAQDCNCGISGTVLDSSGNGLTGVEVRVLGTGAIAHTENGVYSLQLTESGIYDVMFRHLAFRDTVISDVVVNDQEFTVLDVTMTLNGFLMIFGNRDGSVMSVQAGTAIEIPIWGVTPAGNYEDSVTVMIVPLSSSDSVVTLRYPSSWYDPQDTLPFHSYFPDTLVGRWDDVSFLIPNPDTVPGWMNQTLLGFADVIFPREEQNFFWTNGDTLLIGTYVMQLSGDPEFWGDTVRAFQLGYSENPWGLIWGMQDGVTSAIPFAALPSLYIWGPPPCVYVSGDVNGSGDATAWADFLYLMNYLRGYGPPPPDSCYCPPIYPAADANGNCSVNGIDVTYLHEYWRGWGPDPFPCPDCPEPNPDPLQPPSGLDIGTPDTIIIGNLDGTPILAAPGQTLDIPIWVKNDEDVAALNIAIAVDTAYVSEFVHHYFYYEDVFPPLVDWDEVWFYEPEPEQPSPGNISRTFGGWADISGPPNENLNTEGVYQHMVDFTVVMNSDWGLVGDTSEVIPGNHPLVTITTFCDSFGVEEWAPVVVPGRIVLTDEPIPCSYVAGDINGNGEANGVDVSYAVNYFKGYGPPPPLVCLNCPWPQVELFAAGDVNANCQFNGVDITLYVNFLKSQGPPLGFCPVCPPSSVAK